MSCRTANGWSSPYSWSSRREASGFQAGAQEIDLVLLVMDRDAATKMLNSKVSLGADASVAAGPVGRAASASTNANLAQVLSYSRSQGLFAGINLSGGALRWTRTRTPTPTALRAPPTYVIGGKARSAGARRSSTRSAPAPAGRQEPRPRQRPTRRILVRVGRNRGRNPRIERRRIRQIPQMQPIILDVDPSSFPRELLRRRCDRRSASVRRGRPDAAARSCGKFVRQQRDVSRRSVHALTPDAYP